MRPDSRCACSIAVPDGPGMPLLVPRTSGAGHCALPLKGRLIRAFLRVFVGGFKAARFFARGSPASVDLLGCGEAPVRRLLTVRKLSPGGTNDRACALIDAIM